MKVSKVLRRAGRREGDRAEPVTLICAGAAYIHYGIIIAETAWHVDCGAPGKT